MSEELGSLKTKMTNDIVNYEMDNVGAEKMG